MMNVSSMTAHVYERIETELNVPHPDIATGAPPARSRDAPLPRIDTGKYGLTLKVDESILIRQLDTLGYQMAHQLRKIQRPRVHMVDEDENAGWLYGSLEEGLLTLWFYVANDNV